MAFLFYKQGHILDPRALLFFRMVDGEVKKAKGLGSRMTRCVYACGINIRLLDNTRGIAPLTILSLYSFFFQGNASRSQGGSQSKKHSQWGTVGFVSLLRCLACHYSDWNCQRSVSAGSSIFIAHVANTREATSPLMNLESSLHYKFLHFKVACRTSPTHRRFSTIDKVRPFQSSLYFVTLLFLLFYHYDYYYYYYDYYYYY